MKRRRKRREKKRKEKRKDGKEKKEMIHQESNPGPFVWQVKALTVELSSQAGVMLHTL